MQPLEHVGKHEHSGGGQAREDGATIGESGEDGIHVAVRDGGAIVDDAERLPTDVGIGGAPRLLDQAPLVAEMGERGVLDVDEVLEDGLRPGWVDLPREICAAQDVPAGAIDPVPRAQAPRTKKSLSSRPRGRTVCRPDQPFGLELGRGVVGKHLVVARRQAAVVVVFEGLYDVLGSLLPWPQPEPRTSDGHGTARGIDEDARARGARGLQDVARSFDVDFVGEMQQPMVAFVKADVGRGVEDGDLSCRGRVLDIERWRPWGAEGCLDLLPVGHVDLVEIDVLGQARCEIGTRGSAYVENPDPFGMFSTFE